jgi:hypothetical protein
MSTISNGHHGLKQYMIGKHDRAGRLLTDEQRALSNPFDPYWRMQTGGDISIMIGLIGNDLTSAAIEALPDNVNDDSHMVFAFGVRRMKNAVKAGETDPVKIAAAYFEQNPSQP